LGFLFILILLLPIMWHMMDFFSSKITRIWICFLCMQRWIHLCPLPFCLHEFFLWPGKLLHFFHIWNFPTELIVCFFLLFLNSLVDSKRFLHLCCLLYVEIQAFDIFSKMMVFLKTKVMFSDSSHPVQFSCICF